MVTRALREWRQKVRSGHVLSVKAAGNIVGTRALLEWSEKFRLGHVLTVNGGWILIWDVVSPCKQGETASQLTVGRLFTVRTR